MQTNIVIHWDCLEEMKKIPDGSIDAIITDPPYGTTACKWDSVIPFEPMWAELKRIIKPNWAIVLFGSEPFSSALRMSNIKQYKYDWIWEKERPSNICLVKKQPGRCHEVISVFWDKIQYNPQMEASITWNWKERTGSNKMWVIWWTIAKYAKDWDWTKRYPRSVQKFTRDNWLHPTQKPVALIEYLIKTYTNEWETVLDFTAWSGTTWVACKNTGRNYILIEKDAWHIEIIKNRL